MFLTDISSQVVGGDALANWILGIICDLKLPESPSIALIPMGTENNMASSFGWVGNLFVYLDKMNLKVPASVFNRISMSDTY